jgi:hypothetical protein
MPIEIKELVIKVTVDDPNPQAQQQATSQAAQNGSAKTDQDGIVAQCIEQVLSIIQNKKER